MSLTLSPVAKSASLFAPVRVGDSAAVSLIAKKAEARQTALDDLKDMPRKVRDDVRAKARERVVQLRDRMKVIKALGENDPKIMARMLAQLTKELKAAVKAYMDAGGSSSDVSGAMAAQTTVIMGKSEAVPEAPSEAVEAAPVDGASDPVAKAPVIDAVQAAEAYGKAETLKAESEISEVSGFADEVRGIMKKVKEWLETAKIKLTFQPVDKATAEAFAESDETMKSIDEALEDLDDSLGDERAVMGLRMNVEA